MTKYPLLDNVFLKRLSLRKSKEIFAKIISLDFNENPMEEIAGKISNGNISINGQSSARRTCSITLVTKDVLLHDYYWGLNTKFKLFIGLKNDFEPEYEDIIWFPYGIFIITSFNTSESTNSYSISIQGADKISMLNGTLGGTITSLSADFAKLNKFDALGNLTVEELLIKDIIKEVVHTYGKEPYHNIIIQDLEIPGLELLEYKGVEDLYLFIEKDSNVVLNYTLDKNTKINKIGSDEELTIQELEDSDFYPSIQLLKAESPVLFIADGIEYYIVRIETGTAVGYRLTDLTFPGDLIGDVDAPVTTAVLDKIIQMLGEYEYFYDIEGRFVFRRKPTYLYTSWNTEVKNSDDDETYYENSAFVSPYIYSFEGQTLISSISNNPDYSNLKNDFSVWGVKSSSSGNFEAPIHYRYAIDKKPVYYKTFDGDIYISEEFEENIKDAIKVDWREVIYQMAKDYYRHNQDEDFLVSIRKNNLEYYPTGYTGYEQYYIDMEGFWRQLYNPEGVKAIEFEEIKCSSRYYLQKADEIYYFKEYDKETDFGKDVYLYNSLKDEYYAAKYKENETQYYVAEKPEIRYIPLNEENLNVQFAYILSKLLNQVIPYNINDGINSLSTIIENNWGNGKEIYDNNFDNLKYIYNSSYLNSENIGRDKLADAEACLFVKNNQDEYTQAFSLENFITINDAGKLFYKNTLFLKTIQPEYNTSLKIYKKNNLNYSKDYWHSDVKNAPERLNFWFDFLDTDGEFVKYSVKAIGDRPKAINDDGINAIYFRETPGIIFYSEDVDDLTKKKIFSMSGYSHFQIPDYLNNLFAISSQGKSAHTELNNLLNQYTNCAEKINITCAPVYHLEPNYRILIYNPDSIINGEYIIDTINFSLGYNGTMSITATKVVNKIT